MISTRTKDNGATWSEFIAIESYADYSTHGSSSCAILLHFYSVFL